MDLRCESKLHGKVDDEHFIEFKCSSRFCGARPGVVVIHRFDLVTGERSTRKFKDPRKGKP
jgi:hypothetical protein